MKQDVDILSEATAEQEEQRDPASLDQVKQLGARLIAVELAIVDAEDLVSNLKKEREEIRIRKLPAQMSELQLTVLGIGNHVLTLESLVTGSLPKDEDLREKAIEWLGDHGHGGVIKRLLTLDLPKGDVITEHKVVGALQAVAPSLLPQVKYDIHHSTYGKLCREIVSGGEVAPYDTLGIFVGSIVRMDSK